MKIKIIHPTRGRKQQAFRTAAKWMASADHPDLIEYTFSVDIDDSDQWCSTVKLIPKITSNYVKDFNVIKNNNKSAIQAINFAASYLYMRADENDFLFLIVSDDTDCPEHWDTLLLKQLEGKSDFCAKVDDGLQPTLVTMPIMDRVYYERYGYIYHPDYQHMHCDEELTCVAIMTGKYIKLPLSFPHLHYTSGANQYDAIYAKNNATWAQGQATLDMHARNNFGIENPLIKREDIKWK